MIIIRVLYRIGIHYLEQQLKESTLPRPIKWIGLKSPPDYDILTKRPSGTWDIMWNYRDGWVIKPPLYWKTLRESDKILVGHVDREVARLQAEALIQADEKWHSKPQQRS